MLADMKARVIDARGHVKALTALWLAEGGFAYVILARLEQELKRSCKRVERMIERKVLNNG